MNKQYVLWTRFKQDDKWFIDPSQAIELWYKDAKFIQTNYNNSKNQFIGYIEAYDCEKIIAEDSKFQLIKKSPEEAVSKCNEWYPSEGKPYFSLDKDGFTIIDKRPIDES